MPSRSLDDLDPRFGVIAVQFLGQVRDACIPITIICTRRSQAEQDAAVAHGVSQVKHSKHQDGLAIDICPNELLDKKGWEPSSPLWWKLAEIGRGMGLRWGGCWDHPLPQVGKVPSWFFDPGHFEYVEKVIT